MNTEKLILLTTLCAYFKIEMSFFRNLGELGLIEIKTIDQSQYIHENHLDEVEKMIRIHYELKVNFEGIDVTLNLLEKIYSLQNELITVKNRLRLYEN
ncbi:chaperone modulator CbpM [Flavobacterium psychrotolerans]|uniref:MerR family transcriptional regulator n=1 Tax=Flavobacterium psychrotolerans TaxID=2169410 RepID=A0A2U1JR17_9FLAO|nr:chaperone modulator CbpM [Flavobacterium psychrotolerans]PWA07399.1 MerR family transcriptional regulator [Flavobacterium psychrotolerans]